MTSCKRPLANAREVIVVQLQLLDLMIRKGSGAVSIDAATRGDLINPSYSPPNAFVTDEVR